MSVDEIDQGPEAVELASLEVGQYQGNEDSSIVALDRFIQATRDSGYKGTANAIAELVDNSLQAEASRVEVFILRDDDDEAFPLKVLIRDDGAGMDPFTLRQALRFGGSSRFNNRSGLGRYGMGLPNSSLSQARTVTVFSWVEPHKVYSSYLDVDEIAEGLISDVPLPARVECPLDVDPSPTGTIVSWTRCDRLDYKRVGFLERRLAAALGRRFRHFIYAGVELSINGKLVQALDPLYLHPASFFQGGQLFGEPIVYEVRADPDDNASDVSEVTVTFSELPVHEWHDLSNKEKRQRGVSKGAGVSVVRGGREVDYGWFFMGGKRRENYDDWWRCEVSFDPVLDEAFGITHTKQQVQPKAHLLEALVPDLEATARVLNTRARRAHMAVKAAGSLSDAERIVTERDRELKALPDQGTRRDRDLLKELKRVDPTLRSVAKGEDGTEYRILVARGAGASVGNFFDRAYERGRLVLTINPDHPFYKKLYRRLERSEEPSEAQLKVQLDLMLLAMARELARAKGSDRRVLTRFLQTFSETFAALLNGR